MSDALPDPMVPADVDLRDFGFMPLEVLRLRDSDLATLANGEQFKAAVLLWCYSWHQVPAASIPEDDRILAKHSGAATNWKKVKQEALRGFVKCSDGRLYHPVVAARAMEAWGRREEFREVKDNKDSRQKRWREKVKRLSALLRSVGVTPPLNPNKGQLEELCRLHVDGYVDDDVDDRPSTRASTGASTRDKTETAKTGTGTGTGIQEKETPTRTANPTDAGRVCKALKRVGIGDVQPGHPDLLALIAAGASDVEFESAGRTAVDRGKGFAYALGTLKRQRTDAAHTALAMHTGPMPTAPAPRQTATDRQVATMNALTGKDRSHDRPRAPAADTIDIAARVVP